MFISMREEEGGAKVRTDSGVVKEAGLSVNPSKRMNGT